MADDYVLKVLKDRKVEIEKKMTELLSANPVITEYLALDKEHQENADAIFKNDRSIPILERVQGNGSRPLLRPTKEMGKKIIHQGTTIYANLIDDVWSLEGIVTTKDIPRILKLYYGDGLSKASELTLPPIYLSYLVEKGKAEIIAQYSRGHPRQHKMIHKRIIPDLAIATEAEKQRMIERAKEEREMMAGVIR